MKSVETIIALTSCLMGYIAGLSVSLSSQTKRDDMVTLQLGSVERGALVEQASKPDASVENEVSKEAYSAELYRLPAQFLESIYLPTFGRDWSPRNELIDFLDLTKDECEDIRAIVSKAAKTVRSLSFDNARIEEVSKTKTIFHVPEFQRQGSQIREAMFDKLTRILGSERARLLESVSRKALSQKFSSYGSHERRIIISENDGRVHYEEMKPSLHNSGEFVDSGGGSWEVGLNTKILIETRENGEFKFPFLDYVFGAGAQSNEK